MQNRSIISFFFFIYEFMKGHSISWKLPSYQISIETVEGITYDGNFKF